MRNYLGIRVATLAAFGLVAMGARAEAALITLSPSAQSVNVGGSVSVDIMVGLGDLESVGGASLSLSFNNAILNGTGSTNDPDAKMGLAQCEIEAAGDPDNEPFCEFSNFFSAGGTSPYELDFLANDELDAVALKALQGASFRLATLTFLALSPGTSALTFSTLGIYLTDPDGNPLSTQATDGSVTVNGTDPGPAPVPEPATFALFGAGAAVILARRLRRSSARS